MGLQHMNLGRGEHSSVNNMLNIIFQGKSPATFCKRSAPPIQRLHRALYLFLPAARTPIMYYLNDSLFDVSSIRGGVMSALSSLYPHCPHGAWCLVGTVLVCPGHCYRKPQTEWFEQQTFLTILEAQSPGSWFLLRAVFLVFRWQTSYCILPCEGERDRQRHGERDSPMSLLIRTLTQSMDAPRESPHLNLIACKYCHIGD